MWDCGVKALASADWLRSVEILGKEVPFSTSSAHLRKFSPERLICSLRMAIVIGSWIRRRIPHGAKCRANFARSKSVSTKQPCSRSSLSRSPHVFCSSVQVKSPICEGDKGMKKDRGIEKFCNKMKWRFTNVKLRQLDGRKASGVILLCRSLAKKASAPERQCGHFSHNSHSAE